jgi:hypothetical protein
MNISKIRIHRDCVYDRFHAYHKAIKILHLYNQKDKRLILLKSNWHDYSFKFDNEVIRYYKQSPNKYITIYYSKI